MTIRALDTLGHFEARFSYPSGITNRWPVDEGSGTTWADAEGSVSATPNNGTWVSNSSYVGGYAVDFNSTDGWWVTDSTLGINNQSVSYCGWVKIPSGYPNYFHLADTPATSDTSTGLPSDGWVWEEDGNGNLALYFRSGGSNTDVLSTRWTVVTGEWVFVALSIDSSDNANMYVWDTTGQIYNQSGSGTRGGVGTNLYLRNLVNGGSHVGAVVDSPMVSTSTVLTESQFQDIWNHTNR